MKFKVGDKVRAIGNGRIETVRGVPGTDEYDSNDFGSASEGFTLVGGGWRFQMDYIEIGGFMSKYCSDTVRAIEESIWHHEDNLHMLKTAEGCFSSSHTNEKRIGDKTIPIYGDTCALCQRFKSCLRGNEICPLKDASFRCVDRDAPWEDLRQASTKEEMIEAEEVMIKTLKGLLEGEVKVSKYDELKERISNVSSWNKETDDLLQEIGGTFQLIIPCGDCCREFGRIYSIDIVEDYFTKKEAHEETTIYSKRRVGFKFTSQREKLDAFKSALTWLLNHSSIKKSLVGSEIKVAVEGDVYRVKVLNEVCKEA